MALTQQALTKLLGKRSHVWLDVACGGIRDADYLGMNPTAGPVVDVVHNYRKTPWPFPKETFSRLVMRGVVERLPVHLVIPVLDEAWRVATERGVLLITTPYAGSWATHADPLIVHAWNEGTPSAFDPDYPLYQLYKPKPWKIDQTVWHADGNLEIALRKRQLV
jgi:hypothetical protein